MLINQLRIKLIGAVLLVCGLASGVCAQQLTAAEVVKQVRWQQNLNAQVPRDLTFFDEAGREVRLGDFLSGNRPVLLNLIFYKCAGSCTLELEGITKALGDMKTLVPSKDFEVVTVSINPKETPAIAAAKKEEYLNLLKGGVDRASADQGWHFLTGSHENVQRLAKSVGFYYAYDLEKEQFAHPSGVMVLTPEGKVSHYLFGVNYLPRDLRFALIDASRGKIGSPVEKVLLLTCYQFNPTTGKYSFAVIKALQATGILTFLILGTFMATSILKERRQPDDKQPPMASGSAGV